MVNAMRVRESRAQETRPQKSSAKFFGCRAAALRELSKKIDMDNTLIWIQEMLLYKNMII